MSRKNVLTFALPVAVLLFAALLGGIYFLWVDSRESYFASRYFRLLDRMGRQIERSIQGHRDVIHSAVRRRDVRDVASLAHQADFAVSCDVEGLEREMLRRYQPDELDDVAPEGRDEAAGSTSRPCAVASEAGDGTEDSLSLELRGERLSPWLVATLSGAVNLGERWSQDIDSIEIRTDLEPLVSRIAGRFMVGPFDDTGRFDSVLVIDRRGTEIVFAPPRAEAQVRSLEELRTGAGDVYQVDLRADPVVVRFGGNRYQLFVKPLPIRIAALAEDEEDVHADWMIVGLVSASRFRTDSIAIHYGLVAAAVLLSLFLLLAYPLLELAFMGSRDSFSRVRLARLVVSVMLGSSFGALCVVDLLAYMTVKRITDGQLEQLSTRVEAEFVKERREMESLLERLSGEAFVDRVTSSSSRHRRVDSMLQHRPWRDEALGAWGATEGKEEEEDRYFDGINTIA